MTVDALKTLFVFVDGLGLGSSDPGINPLYRGQCPCLLNLLNHHSVPVDACMGVPGIPQSATGQATLLTGVNAAAQVGRHVEGFPGPELKRLVCERNLLGVLLDRGYRPAFANAYYVEGWTEVQRRKMQSVTTVAVLSALGQVRDTRMMLAGEAVYQDLTRSFLRTRGYEGPLTTPRQSAADLLRIAAGQDFTLFEYFQTDRHAHKGAPGDVERILSMLDEFLERLLPWCEQPGRLFLLTSDHGNIEDSRTSAHTGNPVPLAALGAGAAALQQKVKSLADFTPAILDLYPPIRC